MKKLKMVGVLIAAMIFSSIRADPESFNSSSCSLALCTYDPTSFKCGCPSSKCSQIPEEIDFESVKHLDLRNNEISSIEFKAEARGLEYLDLSNNSLKSISMGTFFPVDNLKVLKLSDNQLDQTVIEDRVFFGNVLVELYLDRNRIEALSQPNAFYITLGSTLEILDLSQNRISSINHNAINDLKKLSYLDLSRNSLEQLVQIHLMGLSNLLSFNVSENRLTSLPEKLFHGCSRLRMVDLSRNFIRDVHPEAFFQVIPSLEVLHLERNQIDRITPHLLDSKTLKEIYLDDNLLTAIDVGAFGPRLSVISIQNSHLVELQSGAISGFDNLQNVTIANNPWLKSLSNMTFGGESSKVLNLNLANNALTSLSPILVRWGNMTSVNLTGNKWNCDCTMTWMMDSVHGDQVTCSRPLHLMNQPLRSLDPTAFSCNPAVRYRMEGAFTIAAAFTIGLFGLIVCLISRYHRRIGTLIGRPSERYETLYNKNEDSINGADGEGEEEALVGSPSETTHINFKTPDSSKIANV